MKQLKTQKKKDSIIGFVFLTASITYFHIILGKKHFLFLEKFPFVHQNLEILYLWLHLLRNRRRVPIIKSFWFCVFNCFHHLFKHDFGQGKFSIKWKISICLAKCGDFVPLTSFTQKLEKGSIYKIFLILCFQLLPSPI